MARLVKYKPSFRGIKVVRSSREVDADLERRADRIAAAAQSAYRTLGEDIDVEVLQAGSDTPAPRARVAVIARAANALAVERDRRVLGGSLDAGR
jgi:hypothetical protein